MMPIFIYIYWFYHFDLRLIFSCFIEAYSSSDNNVMAKGQNGLETLKQILP